MPVGKLNSVLYGSLWRHLFAPSADWLFLPDFLILTKENCF